MSYKKLPATSGGTGGTTDDITNNSSVTGTTTSDALDNLQSDVNSVEFITVSTQYKPQSPITLAAGDIANKYIILDAVPTDAAKTILYIINAGIQEYGVDFEVTSDDGGKRLSWNGLALDGELAVGDVILPVYN